MLDPKFFASLRRACRPGTWSAGVNLARAGAVAVESRDESEIVLRVRAPGRAVAPSVVLYPEEREWDCDCGGRVSPCEHIAAAAIALEHAGESEAAVPEARAMWRRVVYRLARSEGGLTVTRALVSGDGSEEPLVGSLTGVLANPDRAATLQIEEPDLRADRLLEKRPRGLLPPTTLDALLKVLVGTRNVMLDGRPVAIAEEEVLPAAVVEDQGDEVVVTIRRDPRVTEVLSAGVALCGDSIARLGELELGGAWLQHLPIVRVHAATQIGEVATKVLPELSRRMAVDVRSRRLPRVVRDLAPRVQLELRHVGPTLSVLATLVYGAPPVVRIDDGRMVSLDRKTVPLRDEAAEKRLLERLRAELGLLPGRRMTYEGADVAAFVDKVKRWRGDVVGDGAALLGSKLRLAPRLAVTASDAGEVRFALDFVATDERGDERKVEAAAVIRAWREGLGLVPLDGGGWAPLPQAWLDRHGDKVADLLAARDEAGRVSPWSLPVLGELCHELEVPPPPTLDRLRPLAASFDRLPEPSLPDDLAATLRPYQRQAVAWLQFLEQAGLGGVLADDMGLGKTLEALCAFSGKTLVVCPTSVIFNWQAELARFRPRLRVGVYHGPGRSLDEPADVTLTSYAILRLDAERLQAVPWQMVVLDEAQAIKNPDSQVARAAFALPGSFRLALTGTPVENRLEELWSLMHFANRGLLGGRRDFDDRYARPIADGDAAATARLRARIRPFVLRRLKKEVAPELPPRTESVLFVQLDERERAVYDAVRAATQAEVVRLLDEGGGVMKALEALLRLRQAACHAALVPGQPDADGHGSSKTEALMDALQTAVADGHRALVFSQWTSLLDLVEPQLAAAGLGFARLDGSTVNRGDVVARFQAQDGPPVMLLSLKAGGTGLNLTAADHVFLLDPWWNPAVEDQAADRAHRIGQERPVLVHRLVSLGTVEERILKLQERKRALVEAALADGAAAGGLTRDDLLALLS